VASTRAEENLANITVGIVSTSTASGEAPTADMVLGWHRKMVDGILIPDDAYRGAFRGSAHPALLDYEATVGGLPTTRACEVAAEVDNLISELQDRVLALDELDSQGDPDVLTAAFVEAVLDTAAWLHGEWIRIHPFVNGNGRTRANVGSLALQSVWPSSTSASASTPRYGIRPRLLPEHDRRSQPVSPISPV